MEFINSSFDVSFLDSLPRDLSYSEAMPFPSQKMNEDLPMPNEDAEMADASGAASGTSPVAPPSWSNAANTMLPGLYYNSAFLTFGANETLSTISGTADDVAMTDDFFSTLPPQDLRSPADGIFGYLERNGLTSYSKKSKLKYQKSLEAEQARDAAMALVDMTESSLDPTLKPTLAPRNISKRTASSPLGGGSSSSTLEHLKRQRVDRPWSIAEAMAHLHKLPTQSLVSQPRELRDHIYTSAVRSARPIRLERIRLPGLCYASRKMREEATPVYYSVNKFEGHLHMVHSYAGALDPAKYHQTYQPATICPRQTSHLSRSTFADFAVRDIKFEIWDRDAAHFASLEISVSKRGKGSVMVKCTEGPEMVADSEIQMCMKMRSIMEPMLWKILARENFEGLTMEDLKLLVEKVTIPYVPDDESPEDEEED